VTPAVGLETIGIALPDRIVTNDDLGAENPGWRMQQAAAKAGVLERHIAGPGETALDLAVQACQALRSDGALAELDGIVFCTQTPDYVMPSNAFLLQERLGLPDQVLAFDVTLACSGFVYGLAVCRGLILGGQAQRLLLVTADTYSRLIHPGDRSARVLFGDGAAATVVAAGSARLKLLDFELWSSGKNWRKFWVPAGGFRERRDASDGLAEVDSSGNVRTRDSIHMDGLGVWSFVNSVVPAQVGALLSRNRLGIGDIDLFVFHQASALTLDSLERLLKIPAGKSFRYLERIGNTVSASIPIALARARDQGLLVPGMRILIAGFGVGLSAASALVEV
jgi:3-oxoacyl-[acyl-carrier-protein] synthase-3